MGGKTRRKKAEKLTNVELENEKEQKSACLLHTYL